MLQSYRGFVRDKDSLCKKVVQELAVVLQEMADVFSHGFSGIGVQKQEKLKEWFCLVRTTLLEKAQTDDDLVALARQVKRSIAKVAETHDMASEGVLGGYIQRLFHLLDVLAAHAALDTATIVSVEEAADASYAWNILDEWLPQVEHLVLQSTHSLRAVFHKFSLSVILSSRRSAREGTRRDLLARAASSHLETRLRSVLQAVPRHLFAILRDELQPSLAVAWPAAVDKTELRSSTYPDAAFKLAEVTYRLSNMSVGISRMALRKVISCLVRSRES